MNRQDRRRQRKIERIARRKGLPIVKIDPSNTRLKDAFAERMCEPDSEAAFNAVLAALERWQRDNPTVELEWHPHPEKGATYVFGPLGLPDAQRFIAKNEAAMQLLAHLDRETGGTALTLHALIALEALGMVPLHPGASPPPGVVYEAPGLETMRAYAAGRNVMRMPESACPWCGTPTSGSGSTQEKPPEPGDHTICVRCGGVASYTDQMHLRKITGEEWAALPDELRAELQGAAELFASRGVRPKTPIEA